MRTKVTNKLGLPRAFVIAIEEDPYDPDSGGQHSDYTITGLLKPPRMAQLQREHSVTEDASERLFSLQGQIIHGILERAKPQLELMGFLVEKRFYKKYEVDGQVYVVSAQVDVYDPMECRLSDYKYTSVEAANKGLKDEHKWQVNFQSLLVREAGHRVRVADATLLLRNWSAERSYAGYPDSPCMVHSVPLLSEAEVNAYVVERIRLHEAAKKVLPLCSEEERWERPTWALYKSLDDKKAARVFDTEAEALEFNESSKIKYKLVKRPGTSIRCRMIKGYCPVRTVCEQAKGLQPTVEKDSDGFIKVS